ncbi:MAG: diguanylate cyclase [Cyanobacteria bacterium]|nr:diguanylate cyclase [Cyanobacteriota bacterium]
MVNNKLGQSHNSNSAEPEFIQTTASNDSDGKPQKRRLQITSAAIVFITICLCVMGLMIGHKIELALFGLVVVALLVYTYFLQAKFLRQHETYERKLHTMASTIEERNRELKRLVMIDPLTEVLNRRGFERVLTVETSRARRNSTQNYALLIDCDDFKGINEKFGHSVGDIVLQELSGRLQKAIRPTDHIARIGGDEFVILLPEIDNQSALQVAERVRLSIADTPINFNGGTTKVTTSTGITALGAELHSIEEILAAAGSGLKKSKTAGKNTVCFSKIEGPEGSSMAAILEAVRSGANLSTAYQPISRLDNHHLIAYEMQCRGPEGVFEEPEAFYRLARENSMLTAVDLRCLKRCLESLNELPDSKPCHIKVYPSTILDIPIDTMSELFGETERGICVEVSSREFFASPQCLKDHIEKLKELNVRIAIDRLGYGFSSLEGLLLIEPQFVKLDKSLVKQCSENDTPHDFVRKLVKVLSSLNCQVIADGIDSEEDVATMVALGVELGQGRFLGVPAVLTAKSLD